MNSVHGTQLAESQSRPAAVGEPAWPLWAAMSLGHQEDREAEQVYPEHSWLVGALVWLTWEQLSEILLGSRAVLTSVSYFSLHPRDPGAGSTSVLFSPSILP